MPKRSRRTRTDHQRKDPIDLERPLKQLQTHNVLTDNVEIYDSLSSHRLFPGNGRDAAKDPEALESYSTLINTSSTRARDEKVLQWRGLTTKGILYGSTKLSNKLSPNVLDKRQNVYQE